MYTFDDSVRFLPCFDDSDWLGTLVEKRLAQLVFVFDSVGGDPINLTYRYGRSDPGMI